MSQCTNKALNEYKQLRHLLSCKPQDKELLFNELRSNYFYNRINTVSDVRSHLTTDFEDKFFNRETKQFFGTYKYSFSKPNFELYCHNAQNIAVYSVDFDINNQCLTLNHTRSI